MSELSHFGIKGMKWGVRRPEGPDGRVRKDGSSPATDSDDAKTAAAAKAKAKSHGVSSLSNKELQDLNNRLNLEQNYSRLTEGDIKKGRDYLGIAKTVIGVSDTIDKSVASFPKPVKQAVKSLVVASLPSEVVSVGKTALKVGGYVKTGAKVGVSLAEDARKLRG